MDKLNEFKRLLFEGPVKFSFTKKDGTIREALGTMNRTLVPKTESFKCYICTDIQWDADDDEKADLPEIVRIKEVPADLEGDELEEFLADQLSRHWKFCVKSFAFEDRAKKSMPADSVLFYDLERGGFRSCKFSSVISFEPKA